MADEPCTPDDVLCWTGVKDTVSDTVQQVGNDALSKAVEDTFNGFGSFVTQLAFAWIYAPTPSLSAGGVDEQSQALPDGVITLLEQAKWLGFAIAILSLLVLGGRMVMAHRQREGAVLIGRLFWIFAGIGLIAGAGGVVAHLLQGNEFSRGAGAGVGFVQVQLFPWMAGLAMLGMIVGGAKVLWTQRGEDGRAVLGNLIQLVVVSAACVVVTNVLMGAFDGFSVRVLESATQCDFAVEDKQVAGKCFGGALTTMVLGATTTAAAAAGPAINVWGPLVALIVIVVVVLLTLCQFVLMIFRSAVIILMVGVLPTSAAFTNLETGKQWFRRICAWLLAALLYKPVAALIIATGIRIGSTVPTGVEDLVWNMLMGGAILTLSVIALPALMKLMVPAVAAAAGSSGGTMMGAVAGSAIANGAIDAVSSMSRSNSSSSKSQSNTHSSSRTEPTGADTSGGGKAVPPSPPGGPSGAGAGSASAGAGSAAGGSAAAAGGSAAAGAGAGGAAAGGAAAGSAAGPVGMAAGAAVATATKRVGEGVGRGIAQGANGALGDQNE